MCYNLTSLWMIPYIDFNTDKRGQATTDFERDFYRLINNSVFDKTMENLRNRVNVSLCNDEIKAKKMIALPTFKHAEIINENLVMIHRLPTKNQTKQTHRHGVFHSVAFEGALVHISL